MIRNVSDYLSLLKIYPHFEKRKNSLVTYNTNHTENLKINSKYKINELLSTDSFIENIFNVIKWLRGLIPNNPCYKYINDESLSGIQLLEVCLKTQKRLNCAGYAKVLNDILLSQGILSKCIWGLSSEMNDTECHVFNHVYNYQANKWMVVDPALGFCVMNKDNTYMDVLQLREAVKNQTEIICKQSMNMLYAEIDKKRYLDYIPKNLFMFGTFKTSGAIYDPLKNQYCYIVPNGYVVEGYDSFLITHNANILY